MIINIYYFDVFLSPVSPVASSSFSKIV